MELHEKQTFRRVCYSKPMIIVLFVVAFLLIRGTYGIYEKAAETTRDRDRMQAKLAELQAHQQVIANQVDTLQTDEGLERALRQKFGVARAGESIALIVDSDENATTTVSQEHTPTGKVLDTIMSGVRSLFGR